MLARGRSRSGLAGRREPHERAARRAERINASVKYPSGNRAETVGPYRACMSFRARLRVELPDRPGALAKVAAVIAAHGGNLVGVDVQEVEQDSAIDELVVDVPDGVNLAELRDALLESGAGVLVSHQSGAQQVDPVLRSLRWACAMVAAGPAGADDELTRAVAETSGTNVAWVCNVADAGLIETGRLAITRGGPVSQRTSDVPASQALGL